MKRKIIYWVGASGILLIVVGSVLKLVLIPKVVRNKVTDTVALRPGTEAWERWENFPVDLLFRITLFEVTNPEEVSRGEPPRVKERGPFVYRERRRKKDIVVEEEEDRAIYYEENTYEFAEDLSSESDETEITLVNVPAVALAQIAESLPGLRSTLSMYNQVISKMWPGDPIFIKARAKDFLFHGIKMFCGAREGTAYERLMWKLMCLSYKYISPRRSVVIDNGEPGINTFALFRYRKFDMEGPFEVKLGLSDIGKIGNIISWRGMSDMGDMWGGPTCRQVTGTDTTIFRPFLQDVDTVTVFNTDICRTLNLTYSGPEEYKGVPVRRYVIDDEVLASVKHKPDNYCYCPRSVKGLTTYGGCLKTGVLDLSSCQGAPVTMSFPHFLGSDPFFESMVHGLHPNRTEHQSFIDLEPNTGYPMRGTLRGQINMVLKRIPQLDCMRNFSKAVLPIMWLDEGVELKDEQIEELKSRLLNLLLIADVVCYVIIGIGSALVLWAATILIIKIIQKKSRD